MAKKERLVLWFDEIGVKQVPQVGGKNAFLGEMYQSLKAKGVYVPNGFVTTAAAFQYFLKITGLEEQIKKILKGLNPHNIKDLMERGRKVRALIVNEELPVELEREISEAYEKLSRQYKSRAVDVAVRSSATAENDLTASFAGQMETFLNVHGEKNIIQCVKKCYVSLYTDRAIVYRLESGFEHVKTSLSVGVQKMVRSDLACSGVMYSVDAESGFDNVTVINSSWGLGENIVNGRVNPDEFRVFEPLLDKFKPIIGRKLGLKEWRMVYDNDSPKFIKNLKTTTEEREIFTLNDKEILQLAKYSVILEKYYKSPMDIEWAKDGKDGKLYIVQALPATAKAAKNLEVLENYRFVKKGGGLLSLGKEREFKLLTKGIAVGSRIASGQVNIIKDAKDIEKFKPGQILVTETTDPDWVPVMKVAKAIITDTGGRVCHAAIISRELGIPCVVGCEDATKILKPGQKVTVSCAEGQEGHIYEGLMPFKIEKTTIKGLKRPKTKIMINVGEPDQAFNFSFIPNDGVGLAREEFIINNHIRIHPLALLNYKKLRDEKVKKEIDEVTAGYDDKVEFYVDKLAEGIGQIASAFYPKDVILRFSDFKSNEYANLIGGKFFEPVEANPMIGWRGASRYYDPQYRAAFDLECLAIKKVRNEFGLDNLIVMVPFCRTPEEGKKVIAILDEHKLREKRPGQKKLQVYVMCEIPANVLMAEEFCKVFDGFSIGSNDLTQLTLGLDRDSGLVSHLFDERNAAVKSLIKQIIQIGKKYKRKVGICGQAPSDFPDFAEFLVEQGIDSISLNPDTVIKTTLAILEQERKLKRR